MQGGFFFFFFFLYYEGKPIVIKSLENKKEILHQAKYIEQANCIIYAWRFIFLLYFLSHCTSYQHEPTYNLVSFIILVISSIKHLSIH